MSTVTAVLDVHGLHWATSAAVVESTLLRRPGVSAVEANALNQTATVVFDPAATSVEQLSNWVRDCGFHCAGRSVPDHICDPMSEPPGAPVEHPAEHLGAEQHAGHAHGAGTQRSPHEMMGHGGHAGMSMDAMVAEVTGMLLAFPDAAAWEPGYSNLLSVALLGGGHHPEAANKERQVDPGATGCLFADEALLPALREIGRFVDQEGFGAIGE